MRKQTADRLRSNYAADQRLCFPYMNNTIHLLHISEISRLYPSSMVVQLSFCRTPRRQFFSRPGSNDIFPFPEYKCNMVHSHCSTNNTTTKTRVQKKKTICSASNRPNTCATSASSVHGFWWNIPWLLVIVACVTGTATGAKSIRPIQITSSVLTLDSCSADSQIVKYRESAITNGLGCPDGAFYLCGYDATKTFIVEYCQPDMECNPGKNRNRHKSKIINFSSFQLRNCFWTEVFNATLSYSLK